MKSPKEYKVPRNPFSSLSTHETGESSGVLTAKKKEGQDKDNVVKEKKCGSSKAQTNGLELAFTTQPDLSQPN